MTDDEKDRILKTFSPRVQSFLKSAEQQRKEDLLFAAQMDKEWEELGKKIDEGLERARRKFRNRELSSRDREEFRSFMSKVLPELY